MRKLSIGAAALLLLAAPAVLRADFVATATLSGANERPNPVPSPATGFVTITFESALDRLLIDGTFQNLTSPLQVGHIHVGSPDVAGPVILPFTFLPVGSTSGTFSGILTAANLTPAGGITTFAEAVNAIETGNAYVNLHTTMFPGGEIRGQTQVVPEPGLLTLLGLGVLGLCGYGRIRRRRAN
jgi:MYXO-CTERM domain-containing protein